MNSKRRSLLLTDIIDFLRLEAHPGNRNSSNLFLTEETNFCQ